ncbi:hypothetical protein [Photobacterium kasasachensis]|uniref:hypothetical protein n=1 Tax=Photobacterium kasasachensis TaxID=2910240 RepID=UPI003D0BA4D9
MAGVIFQRGLCLISEFLPVTVVVTLILFCTREILDLSKRIREKRRMLSTFKLLLAEELKDNFYALDSLYSVLVKVERALELSQEDIPIYKKINTDRYHNDRVNIQLGNKAKYGLLRMPFPRFSTKRYESYLKEVASLDVELYQQVTTVYKELRYCEKIRCEVVEYLERESTQGYWAFDHRVKFMLEKRNEYNESMQSAHVLLTGKHMKIERSEVVETEI